MTAIGMDFNIHYKDTWSHLEEQYGSKIQI